MRKWISLLAGLSVFVLNSTPTFAANPTCAVIKFTNDTRYQKVDAASMLSDLVIEKLLASGKINLVESKPIDQDIEKILYDEKTRQVSIAREGMLHGDFNALFEGSAFDPKYADSISNADVGQIVLPELTSKIGEENHAEYLIQGTIVGMGRGTWEDKNAELASIIGALASAAILGKDSGATPTENITRALFLICDLRVIKASTGEVVWKKQFSGFSGKEVEAKHVSESDTPELTAKKLTDVVDQAAKSISKGFLSDLNDGKIFVK